MDIQIVHAGVQRGPFAEEAVHAMLKEGTVLLDDLAWRPGANGWVPVVNLLYPAAAKSSADVATAHVAEAQPVPAAPKTPSEPATEKQRALLAFMSIPFTSDLSKEAASLLVADAMENPKDPARLARWNRERLRLHPDLFAAEVQAHKESRSQEFFEICQKSATQYFPKITKAHCQVLVAYLDLKFPNWDADEREAVESYFYPAVLEKFPQLVTPAAKGKFKYPGGPKVATEVSRQSPVKIKAAAVRRFPIAALLRGVVFGVILLASIWAARKWLIPMASQRSATTVAHVSPTPTPRKLPVGLESPPPDVPKPSVAASDVPTPASKEEPPTAVAQTAGSGAPPAMTPATAAPDSTPPPAAPPAGEPASPSKPSLFSMDLPANPATPAGSPNDLIAGSPARSTLVVTKPVEIALAYGKIKLVPGTPVKLIQQTGDTVKIIYMNNTATIPASSTNIGTEAAPATGSTPTQPPPP